MIGMNEIRFDNVVLYNNKPHKIWGFGKGEVMINDRWGNVVTEPVSVNDLEGIPLTVEILESFGFEYDNGFYQSEKSRLFFVPQNVQFTKFFAYRGEWNVIDNSFPIGVIDYLHQLQNLWYWLFYEELELNPSKSVL